MSLIQSVFILIQITLIISLSIKLFDHMSDTDQFADCVHKKLLIINKIDPQYLKSVLLSKNKNGNLNVDENFLACCEADIINDLSMDFNDYDYNHNQLSKTSKYKISSIIKSKLINNTLKSCQ